MGFIDEFKQFAMKGNVLDMAVGIIIGVAFGKIITSLVGDVIMPPIGMFLGGVNFSNLFIALNGQTYATIAAAKEAGAATINYGLFISTVIDFVIVALAIFVMVKQMNKLKKEEKKAPVAPSTKECQYCYSTIHVKATRCPHCVAELKA